MRYYFFLLLVIALLGCSKQDSGRVGTPVASTDQMEVDIPFAPAPVDIEIDQSMLGDMDVLGGAFKSDTSLLVSMDASATVDKMIKAVEEKNGRKLAQYEKMGWIMSINADTRFLALHADDYPYMRVQIDSGNFKGRRGYVHKKYLDFDDKGLTLRYFTSNRGEGKAWRSR